MKAIITSDWHFSTGNRLPDFVSSVRKISEYAEQNQVGMLFILGDIYSGWSPSTEERNALYSVLQGFRIPITIVLGNHDINDQRGDVLQHCLGEFSLMRDIGITVIDKPQVVSVGRRRVACIPHLSKHYLSTMGVEYREGFITCVRNSDVDAVFAHVLIWDAIDGPCAPSPRGLSVFDVLDNVSVPFIAGDIHDHKVLREAPLVAYTGAVETNTFNEVCSKKGFYVYDSEANEFLWQVLYSRAFTDVVVSIPDKSATVTSPRVGGKKVMELPAVKDHTQALKLLLAGFQDHIADSVFKLRVYGHKNVLDRIDRSVVIESVKAGNPFSIAGVGFEYTENTIARSSEFSDGISSDAAFRMWHGRQEYADKLVADKVLESGLKAIQACTLTV